MRPEPGIQELLKTALEHHQAGRLRQAEVIYRQVLSVNPDQPDALHWLGILARQAGRNDVALRLIERAAELAPTVAAYQHNYGDMCLAAGNPAAAAGAFRRAAQLPGASPESRVGLAIALLRQKQFSAASDELRLALAVGIDRPQVHQLLATALLEAGRPRESEDACRRALDRGGASAELYQTLGESLGKQNRLDEAIDAFRRAIELQRDFARPHNGIGVALSMLGRFEEAIEHFRQAISLRPGYPQAHFNLGMAYVRQGRDEEAIPPLRRAVELDANYIEARGQLIELLERAGRREQAIVELEQLAKLRPGNREVEFALAALGAREPPPQPPAATITNLFERYAEVFDEHLHAKLRYRAPKVLFEAVSAAGMPARPHVMDLGCGTGLCGELFRPAAASLSGVDLSQAMVAKARARGIYDHLDVGDLSATLRTNPNHYNVIVAADVFVYLGDLFETLSAAFAALAGEGLFGFTVEELDAGTYALRPSRRYAHSVPYLRDVASRAGFTLVSMDRAALRTEGQKDVFGLVAVLRKAARADA